MSRSAASRSCVSQRLWKHLLWMACRWWLKPIAPRFAAKTRCVPLQPKARRWKQWLKIITLVFAFANLGTVVTNAKSLCAQESAMVMVFASRERANATLASQALIAQRRCVPTIARGTGCAFPSMAKNLHASAKMDTRVMTAVKLTVSIIAATMALATRRKGCATASKGGPMWIVVWLFVQTSAAVMASVSMRRASA